jgi:NAD(P)H-hydrate epimerase
VLIVAGRGNNGGDGFVAARHLSAAEALQVRVILSGRPDSIRTPEARNNFDLLAHCGIEDIYIPGNPIPENWFRDADVIVDALLGTGVKGNVREPEAMLIGLVNSAGAKVLTVDTPSGLDPDTGESAGRTVKADLTLTFHRAKKGLLTPEARQYTGEVKVVPIGICADAETLIGRGDIAPLLKRDPSDHKGRAGRVLVIGGGAYSGAPALAAMAALRTGTDIITVAAPASVADIIAGFSPNLIVSRLSGERLCPADLPVLRELIRQHDVTVAGPGLGREEETLETIKQLIPECPRLVLDADALYDPGLPAPGNDVIITPHAGEFGRLAGTIPASTKGKSEAVIGFSAKNKVTTLLKGPCDIISDGSHYRLNRTGNAGMTVGGTGDVLAGIVGSLFARHEAMEAAGCSAFICGTAGDLAFAEKGYGLVATDVIKKIPEAIAGERK